MASTASSSLTLPQKNAIRRLMADLDDWLHNRHEMPCINAMPLDSNIFEWHCSLASTSTSGRFANLVVHLILRFPDSYPLAPPKVKICSPIPHPNVVSYNWICLDMLRTREQGQYKGWTAAYSVTSVLMQLQSLLFELDKDLVAKLEQNYSGSTNKPSLRDTIEEVSKFCCQDCGHSWDQVKPPLQVFEQGHERKDLKVLLKKKKPGKKRRKALKNQSAAAQNINATGTASDKTEDTVKTDETDETAGKDGKQTNISNISDSSASNGNGGETAQKKKKRTRRRKGANKANSPKIVINDGVDENAVKPDAAAEVEVETKTEVEVKSEDEVKSPVSELKFVPLQREKPQCWFHKASQLSVLPSVFACEDENLTSFPLKSVLTAYGADSVSSAVEGVEKVPLCLGFGVTPHFYEIVNKRSNPANAAVNAVSGMDGKQENVQNVQNVQKNGIQSSLDSLNSLSSQLFGRKGATNETYLQKIKDVIGSYPVLKNVDTSFDIVSRDAFENYGVRKNVFGDRHYSHWMPLYMNRSHGKLSMKAIERFVLDLFLNRQRDAACHCEDRCHVKLTRKVRRRRYYRYYSKNSETTELTHEAEDVFEKLFEKYATGMDGDYARTQTLDNEDEEHNIMGACNFPEGPYEAGAVRNGSASDARMNGKDLKQFVQDLGFEDVQQVWDDFEWKDQSQDICLTLEQFLDRWVGTSHGKVWAVLEALGYDENLELVGNINAKTCADVKNGDVSKGTDDASEEEEQKSQKQVVQKNGKSVKRYHPMLAIYTIANIMKSLIENVMQKTRRDGGTISFNFSKNVVQAFCQYHHMLLGVYYSNKKKIKPVIQEQIKLYFVKEAKKDTQNGAQRGTQKGAQRIAKYRNKSNIPDFGVFLMYLTLWERDDKKGANYWNRWDQIGSEFLDEALTRQAKFVLNEYPEVINNHNRNEMDREERLEKSWDATEMSRKLFMVQYFFLTQVCQAFASGKRDVRDTQNGSNGDDAKKVKKVEAKNGAKGEKGTKQGKKAKDENKNGKQAQEAQKAPKNGKDGKKEKKEKEMKEVKGSDKQVQTKKVKKERLIFETGSEWVAPAYKYYEYNESFGRSKDLLLPEKLQLFVETISQCENYEEMFGMIDLQYPGDEKFSSWLLKSVLQSKERHYHNPRVYFSKFKAMRYEEMAMIGDGQENIQSGKVKNGSKGGKKNEKSETKSKKLLY